MSASPEIPSNLQMNPDVRVRLDASVGDVLVEHLTTREHFKLGRHAAAVLVMCAGGRAASDVVGAIAASADMPEDEVARIVRDLLSNGLLLNSALISAGSAREGLWHERGWQEANDFFLATDDMPFLDYEVDGYRVDRDRMARYRAAAPDPVLAIREQVAQLEPARREEIERLANRLVEPLPLATAERDPTAELDERVLSEILTLTFAFSFHLGKLRRTSPSGGARHPSEAYLIAYGVKGLEPGVYHYDSTSAHLDALNASVPSQYLSGFRPPYSRFMPDAVLLIYSEFIRNMFRYREPRTFRSILLDAGHLAATIEAVAEAHGLVSHVHHAVDEHHLDEVLGAGLLERGFIVGVGIGGS